MRILKTDRSSKLPEYTTADATGHVTIADPAAAHASQVAKWMAAGAAVTAVASFGALSLLEPFSCSERTRNWPTALAAGFDGALLVGALSVLSSTLSDATGRVKAGLAAGAAGAAGLVVTLFVHGVHTRC